MKRLSLLLLLLVVLPAAADQIDDPFAAQPWLTGQAVFSCGELAIRGAAATDSAGLEAGASADDAGHVRSNADVRLVGSAVVHGNAIAGPGFAVLIDGSSSVTGEILVAASPADCRPLDLDALAAVLATDNDNVAIPLSGKGRDPLGGPNHRDLTLNGEDWLTLAGGTYLLDSLTVTGSSELSVAGPVRLLVLGPVAISGSSRLNHDGSPFDLRLWSAGASFDLASEAEVVALVHAPEALARVVGASRLEGALFAAAVELDGGSQVVRVLDDHPPLVEILSPTDGEQVATCEVEVTGRVRDDEGPLDLTVNGLPVTPAADGSFAALASLWSDDPGLIVARAVDLAGNPFTAQVRVVIAPPAVSLVSPAPGTLVGERVLALAGSCGSATQVVVEQVPAMVAAGAWSVDAFDLGPDGLKLLTMTGSSCAGSVTTSATLDLDTLPPELAVTSPADGSATSQPNLIVSGSALDPHLAAVTVNGQPASLNGGAFSAEVPLAEGANPLTVLAVDSLGHSAAATLTVTLDTTPPQLVVLESGLPVEGELELGRPAVFTVRAEDATAVEVSVTIDGQLYLQGTPYSAPGPHLLHASGRDAVGNSAFVDLPFLIDDDPPLLEVLSPLPGSIHDATAIDLVGRASADVVEVTVAGAPATLDPPGGDWRGWTALAVALEQEGLNLIAVSAADRVGNLTALEVPFERDILAPALELTSPAPDLVTRLATLQVAGTAVDAHLEQVLVNGVAATLAPDGAFVLALTLVEGVNTVTVEARDSLGHASSVARSVTLDSLPPEISVAHGGAPLADGLLTNQPVTPVVEVTDATAIEVVLRLNGAPFVSGTAVAAEGVYLLEVEAVDAAGNSARLELRFTVDLTPPLISGLDPADGSVLANPAPTLTGVADDALEVLVNGQPATLVSGLFSFSGLALAEGSNPVTVQATDRAGNVGTRSLSLILDTIAPELAISQPADGELVGEAEVLVRGTASDPHLERVEVAGLAAALAGDVFQARAPLTADGPASLTVTATDTAGNSASASVNVERDTAPPQLSLSEPGAGAVLAVPSVVVTGAALDPHLESVTVNTLAVSVEPAGSFTTDLNLPEGRHTLVVEAADALGHRASLERELTIDLSAPEVHITSPERGALLTAAVVEVVGVVAEPAALDRLTVNGVATEVAPDGSFLAGGIELPEGEAVVTARAWDQAGNTGTASVTVTVDTVAPAVERIVPADGATAVPPSVLLEVRFSEPVDPASLAASVTLSAAGQPLVVTFGQAPGSPSVLVRPTAGLTPDAEHTLAVGVGVTDLAGHPLVAAAASTFSTSDTAPPAPPVVEPPPSPACFTSLGLTGTAEPATTVEATGDVQAASAAVAEDGSFGLELVPTRADGALRIRLTTVDASGNRSTPLDLAIELDCAPPYVRSASWDGAATITLDLSEVLDLDTVVPGVSLTLSGASGPLPFTLEPAGATLVLTLVTEPDPAELPLALELSAAATDLAGNPAVPFRQLLVDPATATLVVGEVFDDATSLELAGVTVTLLAEGEPLVVTSDGRGRFSLPVITSPVTVCLEAEGFLPAWRSTSPVMGAATLLFDARLTRGATATHLAGATQLEAGLAELTVDGASMPPEGLDLALTALSEQGLPDLLPLGWQPLAATHLGLPAGVTLDPPAVLRFVTEAPADAVVASFDADARVWRAVTLGTTLEVAGPGAWALVAPDPPPTAPGAAVIGSPLPAAEAADPGALAATLTLDPPVILPMERALAWVSVTSELATPSGLPVEARLDEVLHVIDGGVLVMPPSATDLVLYNRGGELEARFGLGASDTARAVALDQGVKTIAVRALPAEVRTQDLVGPDGGEVLSPDGIGLAVPAGALDRTVAVGLVSYPLDGLPLALPAGLEAVAAASLDLGGAVLALPATLSFPSTGQAEPQLLVLTPVEVDGATRWRLVGIATVEGERIACGPASMAELPAPLVRATGLYVLVRPLGEAWGLVSGTVLDVPGTPLEAPGLVDVAGGLVQLPDDGGVYALAAPAGAVRLDAMNLVSRDQGGVDLTLLAGEHAAGVDISLKATGPQVEGTSPGNGATNVSQTAAVAVDFSEVLEQSSTIDAISVQVTAGPTQEWTGITALSVNGDRLTWTPDEPFPSASRVEVTVSADVRDLWANPMDAPYAFAFAVERVLLPDDVHPERIRLFAPGRVADDPTAVLVEGEAGAVPGNGWLWVEDLDHAAPTTTFQAEASGAFARRLRPEDSPTGLHVGDRLVLHILGSPDPGDSLGVVPLGPWLTPDGLGAWFDVGGGSFRTDQSVGVIVPFGALPEGGSVRVERVPTDQALPAAWTPSWVAARVAVEVELDRRAAETLQLVIPSDTPPTGTGVGFAAMILDLAGDPHPMVVRTAWWDAELEAWVTGPPDQPVEGESAAERLDRAAAAGNPDPLLPGIRRSMTLVVLEPVAGGFKSGERLPGDLPVVAPGEAGDAPRDGQVVIRRLFKDAGDMCAYLNTNYAPVSAVMVVTDGGGGGLNAMAGFAFALVEGLALENAATLPVQVDRDFVLTVADPDTGYVHAERGYPAPTGDWLDIPPEEAPGMADVRLELTGGTPFRVFAFNAATGALPLGDGIDVVVDASNLTCAVGEGAVPADTRVALYDLRDGQGRSGSATAGGLGLVMALGSEGVQLGDPMLLVLEGQVTAGDQELRLLFNKPVQGLVRPGDVAATELGGGALGLDLEADGQTLLVRPDPLWKAGARYDLDLRAVFVRAGQGQAFTAPIVLPLGAVEAVSGSPILPADLVSDAALAGDVLLLAAGDAGLQAWDIADPAHPEWLTTSEGNDPVVGVAQDGFGHVVTMEGRTGEHVVLRLRLLAELMQSNPGPAGGHAEYLLAHGSPEQGPGHLTLEVMARSVAFDCTSTQPAAGIRVEPEELDQPWTQITVDSDLLITNHPVVLHDAISRRVLWRGTAGAGDLNIPNQHGLPRSRPLLLRAHTETVVYAHALAGPAVAATIAIGNDATYAFSAGAVSTNSDLLHWTMSHQANACRDLGPADSIFLGRMAMAPLGGPDPRAVVLSAARYDGLYALVQSAAWPGVNALPTWLQCLRSPDGDTLADVAAATWRFDDLADEVPIAAVVGHRRLEVIGLNRSGSPTLVAGVDTGWSPYRVALDPLHRLILVRDNDRRLAVYSLARLGSLEQVADILLPQGAGYGPLVLDPALGLAVTGTTPVQYVPPTVELVADADRDGLLERVEYLQPLGAPQAPTAADGSQAPHLAWVTARLPGVAAETVKVRVEGLGPGGAPLPLRPAPFLPSSTILELARVEGLEPDDAGRHYYVSRRPLLLVADERARSDYWGRVDAAARARLGQGDEANAVYPLCRHCDRDLDGDGNADLPPGQAAPHPEYASFPQSPSAEPFELAAADMVRVSLELGDDLPPWLEQLAAVGLAPAAEVRSVAWMPSPPVGRLAGIEARSDLLPSVELATGSLTLDRTDLVLPAPGLDVILARSYTSGGIQWGDFGWGWSLAGLDRLRPNPDGTVDLSTSSGDRFVFGNSAGHPAANASTLTAWAIPAELKRTSDGWLLKTPDASYTLFDEAGYPTVLRDRHRLSADSGSELRFHWHPDGTLAQISQVNGAHSTDAHPRSLLFTRDSRGLVTKVEDSTRAAGATSGRVFEYTYDSYGRLRTAKIDGVVLAADSLGGATGTVTESYEPTVEVVSPADPDHLARGSHVLSVTDAESRQTLSATYEPTSGLEGRVNSVSIGELPCTVTYPQTDHARVTDADGTFAHFTLDGKGRVLTHELGGVGATSQTASFSYLDGSNDPLVDVATLPTGGQVRHTWQCEAAGPQASRLSHFNLMERARTRDQLSPEPWVTVSTPSELSWAWEYDQLSNQPTSITLPSPPGTSRAWQIVRLRGEPIKVTDPEGRVVDFEIDRLGRRTKRLDPAPVFGPYVTTYEYDDGLTGCGELMKTAGPGETLTPDLVELEYDGYGNPKEVRRPASDDSGRDVEDISLRNQLGWTLFQATGGYMRRSFAYDRAGRLTTESLDTEEGAATVTHQTTAAGLPAVDTIDGGPTELVRTDYSYTPAGRPDLVIEYPTDRKVDFGHDGLGRLLTRATHTTTAQAGIWLTTTYTYGRPDDLPTFVDLPGDDSLSLNYDPFGRSNYGQDAMGRTTISDLDAAGRVRERTVSHSGSTSLREVFDYNDADQLRYHTVYRTVPGGSEIPARTEYVYSTYDDPRGLLTELVDAELRSTTFTYDPGGREASRSFSDRTEISTTYWGSGLPAEVTERPGDGSSPFATYTEYNALGKVTLSRSPGGQVTHTGYGREGRVVFRTGPEGSFATWTTSPLGTRVTTDEAGRSAVETTLNLATRVVSEVEIATGTSFHSSYDEAGRVIDQHLPGDISRHHVWNDDGTLLTVQLNGGIGVGHSYDAGNRLRGISVTGAPDPAPGWPLHLEFEYDALDNLTYASDDQGIVLSRRVWNTGELADETLTIDGAHTFFTQAAYDWTGLMEALTYPDGTVITMDRHDPLGRLTGLNVAGAPAWTTDYSGLRMGGGTAGALAIARTYSPEGLPAEVSAQVDGSQRFNLSRQYNGRNRFEQQTLGAGLGVTTHLGHDPAQRMADEQDRSAWSSVPASLAGVGDLLGWRDPASERLSRRFGGGGTLDDLSATELFSGGRLLSESYSVDQLTHRITGTSAWSFGYDLLGNRDTATSQLEVKTYRHDWSNRLLEVLSDPGSGQANPVATFRYDPLGRRVVTTEAGHGTIRVPWAEQVIAEYVVNQDQSTTARKRLYWADATDQLLLYDWDSDLDGALESRLYPMTDAQGTVQAVADATGKVVESYVYRPDGSFSIFGMDSTAPELLLSRVRPADQAAGRPRQSLELVFSEPVQKAAGIAEIRDGSGGVLFDNDWSHSDDRRRWRAELDPALSAGASYTLYLERLEDLAGNRMATVEVAFTAPAETDELVLPVGGEGEILAVIDGPAALALVSGAPVDPGSLAASSLTLRRGAALIAGSLSLLDAHGAGEAGLAFDGRIILWTPDDPGALLHAPHTIELNLSLLDPAGHPIHAPPATLSFEHLGQGDVIWTAPTDTPVLSASQVGNDRFLHARPYISSLGLYDHRARYYEPATLSFLQPDPLGPVDSPNLYQAFGFDALNNTDPFGLRGIVVSPRVSARSGQNYRNQVAAAQQHLGAAIAAADRLRFELSWRVLRHNIGDTNYRRDVLTGIASIPWHLASSALNAIGAGSARDCIDMMPSPAAIVAAETSAGIAATRGSALVDDAAGLVDDVLGLADDAIGLADDSAVLVDDVATRRDPAGVLRNLDGTFAYDGGPVGGGLQRPTLRSSTKATIEARTQRNAAGEFLDAAGNVIQEPVYGHVYGRENRRILAAAEELGIDQAQLSEYANSRPQFFQIEERGPNLSHAEEMPGKDSIEDIIIDLMDFLGL